ncbi:MAG: T9SS type A sorting domain-containing protein [Bacteroidetes bacterium]|nr:T9SS type A sorting domain-containing protein [Bacteroidota bacterium]
MIYESEGLEGILYLYNDILSIAQQCPFKGGRAVYIACIYVALIDNSVIYDDVGTCLQQGIYRNQLQDEVEVANAGVDILPNPANDFVVVQLKSKQIGFCRIEIKDVLNKIVYETKFNCNEFQTKINTSIFEQGIYFVTVHINDVKLKSVKLSIIR